MWDSWGDNASCIQMAVLQLLQLLLVLLHVLLLP